MIDPSLKKANILIVDDQEANIEVLESFLQLQGYLNIMATKDPRRVLSLYESFKPDIILLDLSMPYLDGFEVMDLLKKEVRENTFLPILVLTADVSNETKIRALSGGANDFLTKPFDLLEADLRIRNLLYACYLQQQLQDQNSILDEKVNERTRELVQKNIELVAAKEKAEASERLKTSFINNISHEIRTPLNGILGFGQIMTDSDLDEDEKNQYLYILNESSERLINTVTNFLEISMIASGNQTVDKHEFHPEVVINHITRHFRVQCDAKALKLKVDQPRADDDITIYTDKDLLFKIFKHLMDNAVKFTSTGCITLGYTLQKNDFVFYVKDTGKGISEDGKLLIFKSFMQEDNSYTRGYEGCGLGLSIAKGLIELLGGKIWVESEKEKGSTFFFTIPDQPALIKSDELIQQPELSEGIRTILVAEDDDINFTFIKILLKSDFTKIIHARNGEEAVNFCKTNKDICVALIDLKMPLMDGYDATRQIKAFWQNLPVIAVTAYSSAEDKQRAMEAGCDEFITKPVSRSVLYEKLAKFGIVIAGKSQQE